jgi:hypothetical protein
VQNVKNVKPDLFGVVSTLFAMAFLLWDEFFVLVSLRNILSVIKSPFAGEL